MQKLEVFGGKSLKGTIKISSSQTLISDKRSVEFQFIGKARLGLPGRLESFKTVNQVIYIPRISHQNNFWYG